MRLAVRLLRPAANQNVKNPKLWQDPVLGYFEPTKVDLLGKTEFLPGQEYNLTDDEKKAVLWRYRVKEILKKGEGVVMDPSMFRWYSADMTQAEFFRFTPRSVFLYVGSVILIFYLYTRLVYVPIDKSNEACLDGEMLWWDRQRGRTLTTGGSGKFAPIEPGFSGMAELKAALKQAKKLLGENHSEDALNVLQELLDDGVEDYMMFCFAALAHANLDDKNKAKNLYEKAIKLDGKMPIAWQGLFKLYDTGKLPPDERAIEVSTHLVSLWKMRLAVRLLRPAANQNVKNPKLWQDPVLGYFETHGKTEFLPGQEYNLTDDEKKAVLWRYRVKEILKKEYLRRRCGNGSFNVSMVFGRYDTGRILTGFTPRSVFLYVGSVILIFYLYTRLVYVPIDKSKRSVFGWRNVVVGSSAGPYYSDYWRIRKICANPLLKQAKKLLGENHSEDALNVLQELLDDGVEDYMMFCFAALAHANLDDKNKAKNLYEKAIKLDGKMPIAWQGLFKLYDTGKLPPDERAIEVSAHLVSLWYVFLVEFFLSMCNQL
ncbi:tetratricopeptide repeat protein, partial [Ostertagia ostertagi]